jgi:hypothetical protein
MSDSRLGHIAMLRRFKKSVSRSRLFSVVSILLGEKRRNTILKIRDNSAKEEETGSICVLGFDHSCTMTLIDIRFHNEF